jgi:hypothetical protein
VTVGVVQFFLPLFPVVDESLVLVSIRHIDFLIIATVREFRFRIILVLFPLIATRILRAYPKTPERLNVM